MTRDFFLQTARIGFSKWTDQDGQLARMLWGDSAVTRLICASGVFSCAEIESRLKLEIFNEDKVEYRCKNVLEQLQTIQGR